MKAEEIIQEWDFFFNSFGENVDRHVILAMQEYAKDQIEKDRERVKAKLIRLDVGIFAIESAFDRTPIILD